jgi:peptidoglycan/LPS O-acetylase OafA/YrhL
MKKLDLALAEYRGMGPGFDSLRIMLSVTIVIWHSAVVSYGEDVQTRLIAGPLGYLEEAILPMFFGLSGFLVIGSAARTNSLGKFLTFRALRIVPALSVEVLVSAILLGSVLTTLSPARYFSSPMLYRYFANIVGLITFRLPGLFESNPVPYVNLSLWTIPPELVCYMFLAICIVAGAHLRRAQMLLIVIVFMACIGVMHLFGNVVAHIPFLGVVYRRSNLFACFMAGNLIYLYRDRIPLDFRLFVGCLIAGCFCNDYPPLIYLGSALLAYCVVYLGMCPIPQFPLLRRGDYLNALISLPLAIGVAALSWHLIEKPALALKKHLSSKQAAITPTASSAVIRQN